MKWEKAILLLLDPRDRIIRWDANNWKNRYLIPPHLCFSTQPTPGYTPLSGNCLDIADAETKLIVVSHGSPYTLTINGQHRGPQALAALLHRYGLRRAGLIALKGCQLGKQDFLEDLVAELASDGVLVDWLLAYKHSSMQVPLTSHEGVGVVDALLRMASAGRAKRADERRVTVIKGHVHAAHRAGSQRYC
ncbi:hypothetical protein LJR230_000187 [Trinickia sp. LjRoot230]|uniref:hypothetical protein n=1 Tax=Trinickia sp. LjRoot230 TaxID=3342288 RepID=UPI003ECD1058